VTFCYSVSHKQGTLYLNNIYDILSEYESKTLKDRLKEHWFDEIKRNPDKPSLFRATVHTMRWTPIIIGSFFVFTVSLFNRFAN
jgi:hypothetical protein